MNIEDIKVGETYNVRVKVIEKYGDCVDAIYAEYDAIEGIHIPKRRIGILHPISPENGTKNTETAPKYDPNRKFRKGDIVEPRKGREVYACEWEDCCFHKMDGKYEVQVDEKEGHVSVIDKKTGIDCYVSAFALELVTPVEELEPYSVKLSESGECGCFEVMRGNKCVSIYPYGTHETRYYKKASEAKEAAEAERDRLNAEGRKEMGND